MSLRLRLAEPLQSAANREKTGEFLNLYRRGGKIYVKHRLADILNAAWKAFRQPDFWKDSPQVFEKKDLILKELVLKNIELFEIEQILQEAS